MARYQIRKRGWFNLDMAAFCDVGFILLCFIMVTQQQSREYLNTQVNAPAIKNYPVCSLRDGDELTIVVTPDKKCFIQLPYTSSLRDAILLKMAKSKGAEVSKDEVLKFRTIERFGVSVAALKSLIHGYISAKDILIQPGIPVNDNMDSELTDWILAANQVMLDEHGHGLRISILSDQNVPYPYFAMLTKNLQRHNFNHYSLITQAYHRGVRDSWNEYP